MSNDVHPGDAFAKAWDRLSQVYNAGDPGSRDVLREWHASSDRKARSSRIRDEVRRRGMLSSGELTVSGVDLFAVLLGLDGVLEDADPMYDTSRFPALLHVTEHYWSTGSMAESVAGRVLPRRGYPARASAAPESLDEFCWGAVRVSQQDDDLLAFHVLPDLNWLDAGSNPDQLTVGSIPFLGEGEIEVAERKHLGVSYYEARPKLNDDVLRTRVTEALFALDASGVQLGLIPEACADDRLVKIWLQEISTNKRSAGSALSWILLGTGPIRDYGAVPDGSGADGIAADKMPNRAILVDRRSGEILLTQDKRMPFTLDVDQAASWPPVKATGLKGPADEWMAIGKRLAILEGQYGRLSIMICEDIGRESGIMPGARAASVSHTLAPIFAPPFNVSNWVHSRSAAVASRVGTDVAALTSHAVWPTGLAPVAGSTAAATLVTVRTTPDDQSKYCSATTVPAPSPASVTTVSISELRRL